MQYYTFDQTNSGGFFEDHKYIVVKAPSANEANEFAEKYTAVYFDWDYETDCECCGMRWSPQYEDEEGDEVPSKYGEPDFEDHTHWVGLQHVDGGSQEDWIIYEDYNDPDNFRAGMTVDNIDGWNNSFFKLNDLMKAPEGSTIYGIKKSWKGIPVKVTVDINELIEEGIGYQEYYHWNEAAIDIVLKHKIDEARQEEKANKKKRRE